MGSRCNKRKRPATYLLRWVLPATLVLLIVAWRLLFFFYRIPPSGTERAEWLLMSHALSPEVGDRVLVSFPVRPDSAGQNQEASFILSVAASPYDTVALHRDDLSIVLGADQYWLLAGELDSLSIDSRHVGPVNRAQIKATALW